MKETLSMLKSGQHVKIVAFADSITEDTFHTRGRMNDAGASHDSILEETPVENVLAMCNAIKNFKIQK